MLSTYISIMLRFFWTNPFIFFLWTALVLGFFFFFCSFPLFCWWHFQNVSHFENVSLSQTYLLWLITQSSPLFSSLPKNQLEILLSHSSEVFMIQSWEKNWGKKRARFFHPAYYSLHSTSVCKYPHEIPRDNYCGWHERKWPSQAHNGPAWTCILVHAHNYSETRLIPLFKQIT